MNKKGFTLVELLVVIAIIGLISVLAIISLSNFRIKARDAKRITDARQIQTALELYYDDQGSYPRGVEVYGDITDGGSELALGEDVTCLIDGGFAENSGGVCDAAGTVYMGLLPDDPGQPANGTNYHYFDNNGGVGGSPAPISYSLNFELEVGAGQLDAGCVEITPDGMINSGKDPANGCKY